MSKEPPETGDSENLQQFFSREEAEAFKAGLEYSDAYDIEIARVNTGRVIQWEVGFTLPEQRSPLQIVENYWVTLCRGDERIQLGPIPAANGDEACAKVRCLDRTIVQPGDQLVAIRTVDKKD